MQRSRFTLLAMALAGVRPAGAQEAARPPPPRPELVSGVAHPEATPPAHQLLWIPRALLFVPRWAFWLAMQPVRLGAWAFDRYRVGARLGGGAPGGPGSLRVAPAITADTVFGLTAGLRLVDDDLAGRGERLALRADLTGRYRWTFGARLGSGDRLGRRFTAGLEAAYERRPDEPFFGLGDRGARGAAPALPAAGAEAAGEAIEARFGERLARGAATGELRIAGPRSARLTAALASRAFTGGGGGDAPSLPAVYDASRLPGWDRGVLALHVEAELVHDSRRPSSPYHSRAIDATGWYAAARVAGAQGLAGDPTAYVRYGAEALRLFDLYGGTRILALRVLADSIAGPDGRTGGQISFAELPVLGGGDLLRGYPAGRFRDRARVLGTAEYTWDLGDHLAAYLFVDAGRVLPSLADLALDERLRVGYGGGLVACSRGGFLGRVQLATSRDGGLQLELVLAPGAGRRERPERP